jgi:hypothetical protein
MIAGRICVASLHYRLALPALLAAGLLLLSACGRGDPQPPASTPDAGITPEVNAPLEAGDARFLLARRNVIENVTLSGQGSGIVTLEDNRRIFDLSLSPNRAQIAFVVERPAYTNQDGVLDFGADLYVSGLDGGNLRLLLAHEAVGSYFEAPAWLDDATLLVGWRGFDPSGSTSRIERVEVATGARQVVLDDAAMGALSPDRRTIVYTAIDPQTRVQRLVLEDVTAGDSPRVLVDENDGLALFSAVAFSPDGSRLVFAAVDLGTTAPPPMPPRPPAAPDAPLQAPVTHPFAQDVWLVDPADGTGLHRIADIAENMPSVSWSGDGSSLYVLGPGFLWRLDPATGAAEMLRQSGEPGAIVWLEGG